MLLGTRRDGGTERDTWASASAKVTADEPEVDPYPFGLQSEGLALGPPGQSGIPYKSQQAPGLHDDPPKAALRRACRASRSRCRVCSPPARCASHALWAEGRVRAHRGRQVYAGPCSLTLASRTILLTKCWASSERVWGPIGERGAWRVRPAVVPISRLGARPLRQAQLSPTPSRPSRPPQHPNAS